jgi:hypothetical protein
MSRWIVSLLLLTAVPAFGQDRDPFQKGSVGIEVGAAPLFEIWNLNERRENLFDGSASFWGSFADRFAAGLEFHHAWVFQDTPGAFVQGLSPLVRWEIADHPRWNWYAEVGPGVSWSDLPTPPRGTRFNYLFQGGTGVMRRVGSSSHVVIAYRFFHLSNHRREGRDHNPDFEMMGVYAGWAVSF